MRVQISRTLAGDGVNLTIDMDRNLLCSFTGYASGPQFGACNMSEASVRNLACLLVEELDRLRDRERAAARVVLADGGGAR